MKYHSKIIAAALTIAIVLVLGIATLSRKRKHDSTPLSPDCSPLARDNHSDDPIPGYTESQELPIPPIHPNDPVVDAGSEQADVEFHIGDHQPEMNPSAEAGDVIYGTKEETGNV